MGNIAKIVFMLCLLCFDADAQHRRWLISPRSSSGSSSITWYPTNVAGLLWWFDANTITNVTVGGYVSNWQNSAIGMSSLYATNVTSSQFPWVTNNFLGKTDNRAVVFNAAALTRLNIQNSRWVLSNVPSCTIASVYQDSVTSSIGCIAYNTVGTTWDRDRMQLSIYPNQFGTFGGRGHPYAEGARLDGDFTTTLKYNTNAYPVYLVSADFDYVGGTLSLYTNGNFNISTNLNSSGGNTSSTGSDDSYSPASIGWRKADYPYNGMISEVLLFVPKLSDADRTNLWKNYCQPKFGIP